MGFAERAKQVANQFKAEKRKARDDKRRENKEKSDEDRIRVENVADCILRSAKKQCVDKDGWRMFDVTIKRDIYEAIRLIERNGFYVNIVSNDKLDDELYTLKLREK